MGDQYTIADMAIFPWVRILGGYYDAAELVGLDAYPEVQRVLASFVERPAVRTGIAIP